MQPPVLDGAKAFAEIEKCRLAAKTAQPVMQLKCLSKQQPDWNKHTSVMERMPMPKQTTTNNPGVSSEFGILNDLSSVTVLPSPAAKVLTYIEADLTNSQQHPTVLTQTKNTSRC